MPQMANKRIPKVSIGMPVYNGEEFLVRSIDSILSQDFSDFELIVLDNHSSDETESICLNYSKLDARIRYIRNDRNIGSFENFNRVLQYAEGQYYMWAAYDDLREPSYISTMVSILEADSTLELAFSLEKRIDQFDVEIFTYNQLHKIFSGTEGRFLRLLKFIWYPHVEELASAVYGVFKVETLRRIGGFQGYEVEFWGRDLHLLLKVILKGRFLGCNKPLFLKRVVDAKQKPYQWPQMSAIYPIVKMLMTLKDKIKRDSSIRQHQNDSHALSDRFLLKVNQFLRTLNNWKEVYAGYHDIIKQSDLPAYQKSVLCLVTVARSISLQIFEVPGIVVRRWRAYPSNVQRP